MSHPEVANSRTIILSAAERLFVEKGYHAISMREIADAVGMTKAALYYHFRDKEQLFMAILEGVLNELSALIEQCHLAESSHRGQIEAIVQQIMSLPPERRASLRLASQELGNLDAATRRNFIEQYHTQFIGRITNILAAGMACGEFRALDPGIATWTLLGMMYPYFHVTPVTGVAPTTSLIQQLLSIFFDGLQR
ncbi:MAG TPA: TetR/AcrR family transcriptional regulator [Chloroflexi bacterium]|nr:TetR/AcrR family transcriptional regulator [Chloroflexota bacterium]